MITSEKCWLKSSCTKATKPNTTAPCLANDIFCIKLFKLDFLYNNALVSDKQREHVDLRLDLDGADKAAFTQLATIQQNVVSFVTSGKNLYLHSPITGNGKTAWALRLLQSYFNAIWYKTSLQCHGLFINVPRLLLAIKDSYSDPNEYAAAVKERVLEADLVIWDEVGVKELSPHDHEQLLNFINYRIDAGKANIYTSNLPPEQVRLLLGDRLYSRIINCSTQIKLCGKDKRGLLK